MTLFDWTNEKTNEVGKSSFQPMDCNKSKRYADKDYFWRQNVSVAVTEIRILTINKINIKYDKRWISWFLTAWQYVLGYRLPIFSKTSFIVRLYMIQILIGALGTIPKV